MLTRFGEWLEQLAVVYCSVTVNKASAAEVAGDGQSVARGRSGQV
jgi:hypothetical protein